MPLARHLAMKTSLLVANIWLNRCDVSWRQDTKNLLHVNALSVGDQYIYHINVSLLFYPGIRARPYIWIFCDSLFLIPNPNAQNLVFNKKCPNTTDRLVSPPFSCEGCSIGKSIYPQSSNGISRGKHGGKGIAFYLLFLKKMYMQLGASAPLPSTLQGSAAATTACITSARHQTINITSFKIRGKTRFLPRLMSNLHATQRPKVRV